MPKRKVQVRRPTMSDVVVPAKAPETQEPPKRRKGFLACGILLAIFVVFVVAYFIVSQYLAHQYLIEGNQKFNEHLYTEANQDFVFASALSFFGKQTDADAYAGQAVVANYKGNHELAAANYQKSLSKKSNDVLRERYAEQLFILHNYDAAISELSKIPKPSDSVLYLLAHSELRKNNFDVAKTYIEKISEAANDTTIKNEHLAYFALRDHSNDFLSLYPEISDQEFKKYAEKALKNKTYSAVDLVTLGNYSLEKSEPDFALDFATSALQIENNYRDALVLQTQSYAAREEYDQAQESLDAAMKISLLNKDLWYMQAQIFEAQEKPTEALAAFKKANELGQDSAAFHFAYAKAARASEDFDTSLTQAKKALTQDAENDRVYLQFMFWTMLDAENFSEMQNAAKTYTSAHPNEEFARFATALAEYKLQKRTNFSDVIPNASASSAFAAYLEALDSMDQHIATDKSSTKKLLQKAIDYDTNSGSNGEVAKHAQTLLQGL